MFAHLSPLSLLGLAVFGLLGWFGVRLYAVRSHMQRLQRRGLPMPPHNALLGHLPIVAAIYKDIPADAHAHYLANQVQKRYYSLVGSVFYLDLWPFSDPVLIITDPDVAAKALQLPKHPGVRSFMMPITDGNDINSLHGHAWRRWRRIFNPGFSAGHITSLVPAVVKQAAIFKSLFAEHAKNGDMFLLQDIATKYTLDVIGKVVLDTNMNNQAAGYHPMAAALLDQLRFANFGMENGVMNAISPLRPWYIWRNKRTMNHYINQELDTRYNVTQIADGQERKSKTIIDLALNSYIEEGKAASKDSKDSTGTQTDKQNGQDKPKTNTFDALFHKFALGHMKLFMFGGHDTSASTICYTYLTLSRHPAVLKRVRAEHDAVLGPRSSDIVQTLTTTPSLLNKLPYTLAVIKETLRLFPPLSTPRWGQPDIHLTDPKTGHQLPTVGCLVWTSHHGLHNNPHIWPRASEFLPERFLVGDADAETATTGEPASGTDRRDASTKEDVEDLKPRRNAWRAFEYGARACIGVELAMAEIKALLALTVRDFDLSEAFEEWDRRHPSKGLKTLDGERAYQIQRGGAHPPDGMPVKVVFWSGES